MNNRICYMTFDCVITHSPEDSKTKRWQESRTFAIDREPLVFSRLAPRSVPRYVKSWRSRKNDDEDQRPSTRCVRIA
jgi:hypothetical protein